MKKLLLATSLISIASFHQSHGMGVGRTAGNAISELKRQGPLPSVDVDLSNQRIASLTGIDEATPSRWSSGPQRLNLSNNSITDVPAGFLQQGFTGLTGLDLSKNKIKHIAKNAFKGPNLLRVVDLSDNNLSMVDPELFNSEDLSYLNVSGNPLSEQNKAALKKALPRTEIKF